MPSWLFTPVFTEDLHQPISTAGFLLTVTICSCLTLQSLNHPFSRDCDAFGNCRNSPMVSLLPASFDTAFIYKMRQKATISFGHITFLGWDAGRGCCRWGGTPILQPWPHCWSGCSNVKHSSHTWWLCCRLCKWKNGIHAWQTSLGQGLPNYQKLGDDQQQPQGWEVSLWGLCHGTHG